MSGEGTRLVELLERALPALRVSADMGKSEKSRAERNKFVRDVEAALAPCSHELLFMLNDAVKGDHVEAVEMLWREGRRRVELGQSGTKEMGMITAYIVVQLPALLSEVRRLRALVPASKPECSNEVCEDGIVYTGENCGACDEPKYVPCSVCSGGTTP
jgi:hypothetical protein